MSIQEQRRARFEEKAFAQRFLHSVQRVNEGQFGLQPVGCPTKAEFTARDDEGNYREESLNYAWWAWNAALDSVVIELPDSVANTGTLTSTAVLGYKRECREAIEAAGLKVAP